MQKIFQTAALALVVMFASAQSGCNIGAELQQLLSGAFSGQGTSQKIYIANLSFLDNDTKSVMPTEGSQQINAAVEDGMAQLAQSDRRYVINDPNRTIANTDQNSTLLADIWHDPSVPSQQKIEKIITDLMEPNGVDGLVSGVYIEGAQGTVKLRPLVVSRANKTAHSKTLPFDKSEYFCTNQSTGTVSICQAAHERIRDEVVELLKKL